MPLCILLTLVTIQARGEGVWAKPDHTLRFEEKFQPEFSILKIAVFSNNGAIKPTILESEINKACDIRKKVEAWVTHRLSRNETLSRGAGQRLGRQLNELLGNTCVKAVELNIEPLEAPSEWLLGFLAEFRKTLVTNIRISLAIPMVALENIPGPRLWTPDMAVLILSVVSGIDVMAYDTGATSLDHYQRLLGDLLRVIHKIIDQVPDKTITLGIPSYYDQTTLHNALYESSEAFLNLASQSGQSGGQNILCRSGFRYAFYAEWTMRSKDRLVANRLNQWKKAGCR